MSCQFIEAGVQYGEVCMVSIEGKCDTCGSHPVTFSNIKALYLGHNEQGRDFCKVLDEIFCPYCSRKFTTATFPCAGPDGYVIQLPVKVDLSVSAD